MQSITLWRGRAIRICRRLPIVAFVAAFAAWVPARAEPAKTDAPDEATEITARQYTSARDKREIEGIPLTSWLNLGVLAEAEAAYERQGGTSDSRLSFEELSVAFEAAANDYLSGYVLFLGEFGTDTDYLIEEAFLRLGGADDIPWFVEAGRRELPFGEFESHFVQDPLVQVIGECLNDGVTAGYESDILEVSATLFQGDAFDDKINNWILLAKCDPVDGFECGASFISDIGESTELSDLEREILRDRAKDGKAEDEVDEGNPNVPASRSAVERSDVAGLGVFAIAEPDPFFVNVEAVAAAESFAPGRLDEAERRPWAWHLEAGVRPVSRWEVAVRVEQSDELPGYPDRQYGIATSFGITSRLTLTADFVHGDFDGTERDLDLAGATLTFEL